MGKKTNAISTFLSSRSGQRFFNIAYSVGAAIVIIGAMFKILHLPLADYILGFAMVMEASVFLLSAFDPSIYDDEPTVITQSVQTGNQTQTSGINIKSTTEPTKGIISNDKETDNSVPDWVATQRQNASGGQPVTVVVGGGGQLVGDSVQSTQPNVGGSNVQPVGTSRPQGVDLVESAIPSIENVQGIKETVQGYASNMEVLNGNIEALNNVYEIQLQSLQSQIDNLKFTNDSLERIKRVYDGAVNDGFAFRDETEKMTRNIEALNKVYARLLQAMTATQNNLGQGDYRDRDSRDNRDSRDTRDNRDRY